MNPQATSNPAMSQNSYDTLAALALRVCADQSKPPGQWIYAVDDAWLHCGHGQMQPLFDVRNEGQNLENVISIEAAKHKMSRVTSGNTAKSASPYAALTSVSTQPQEHPDKIPAGTLLDFIAKYAEQNYGICFCTFEYFWHNAKEINQAQNTVFFDIRHQLMASDHNADLKEKWKEALSKTGVFDQPEATSLGIQIYFAFKLGLHPEAGECKINHNHLLILSSNLFGSEGENGKTDTDRANALLSFSAIQTAIWKKAAQARIAVEAGNPEKTKLASLLVREGTDYTFIPMPKHKSDGLFETALEIFHNSFRNAASIDSKLAALWHDMELAWKDYDWGHFLKTGSTYQHQTANLHSFSWLLGDEDEKKAALRGIYHAAWREERDSTISVRSFAEFLKWHCEPDSVTFTPFTEQNGSVTRISLPTCPGILFALAMVFVLRQLATQKPPENRATPNVSWKRDADVVTVSIMLGNNGGVNDFKNKFFGNVDGGSIRALNTLVNSQLSGLMLSHNNKTIGDLQGNGSNLRERITATNGPSAVRRSKTLPAFSAESIQFSFQAF
jgi:hypothetical protein